MQKKTARRLTFTVASHSSAVVCSSGLPDPPTPALFTSTSSPPSAAAAPSTTRRQPATSPRSPGAATARSRSPSPSSAAATEAALLPFTATRAPAARNASTVARPIPRVPPVTRTRLPVRFMNGSTLAIDHSAVHHAEDTATRPYPPARPRRAHATRRVRRGPPAPDRPATFFLLLAGAFRDGEECFFHGEASMPITDRPAIPGRLANSSSACL